MFVLLFQRKSWVKKSISLYNLENQIEEGNYRKNMNKIMLVESLQLLSAQVSADLTYPILETNFTTL